MTVLLPVCVCGERQVENRIYHGIHVLLCPECGVHRQHLRMTEDELNEWYRARYFAGEYRHTYEHDAAVAKVRLDSYQIASRAKLLDVGSGNGAFLAAARARGIDAWGQDLAQQALSEFVYVGALEDIAFPTDEFDVVTVHDVLEHLVRPDAALKEIRRILRRPGKLILDFPRFFDEKGVHHWKPVEHLWMFQESQLCALVERCGFHITRTYHPIPSKFVVEAEPIAVKRPQILTPAGIGDSWWALTKLPGLLAARGLGLPDVWVQDSGGPKRTQPFLRTIPFINAAGYKQLSDKNPIFREAYVQNARTIFPNVCDVDYFIAYNGIMRAGRSLEDTDPEYGCAWRPKMHITKEAMSFRDKLRGPGEYIITYYAEAGMYRAWLNQFPKEKIAEALTLVEQALGARIIFIGAKWDMGQVGREIARMNSDWTDLIGATSYDQMVGAIMGAKAVIGFPAGNTMLGTMFNVPTVLLWNEYFDERFWKNACPPDALYEPLNTFKLKPKDVLHALQRLVTSDVRSS